MKNGYNAENRGLNVIVLHKHLVHDARILKHLQYLVNKQCAVYQIRICRDTPVKTITHVSSVGENSTTIGAKLCHNSFVNSIFFNIFINTRYISEHIIRDLEEYDINPYSPTIIHVHDPVLLFLALRLNRYLHNSKIVYDRHEIYENKHKLLGIRLPSIGRLFEIVTSKWISGLVCVAESQLIKAKHTFVNAKYCVVNNFPQAKQYDCQKIQRKIDSISRTGDIILSYIGSLDYHEDRDIFLMLDIIDEIMQQNNSVRFLLGGHTKDVKLISEINMLANRYPNRFNYLGYIPSHKVVEISQESHIGFFLLKNIKAEYKVSPNKVFEYLYCGCVPIIKANIDYAERLCQCSFIYGEYASKEEIIHDVNNLLEAPDLLQEKMATARDLGQQFTWESVADNYSILYNELIHTIPEVEKR